MTLVDHQFEFLKDFIALIDFVVNVKKYKVTGGELYRPQEMQDIYLEQGKTKAKYSNHLLRCAVDLNFFIDDKLCYDKEKLEEIGVFWENLNKLNRWGGHFKSFTDTPHFERDVV